MANIHDITDYVISRLVTGGVQLNQLKLQKLLYYIQAWHLAHLDKPIVHARFQAWVHGPVNREVFDRFKGKKMLYSAMTTDDIREDFNSEQSLSSEQRAFIDAVLNVYAPLAGDQLEAMTHQEDPWVKARGHLGPDQRCETEIDEAIMSTVYRSRIQQ
jgi:uncharacterized phage-associated protein